MIKVREPHEGLRRHKLLTAEARRKLPALYANEKLGDPMDAVCQVKFFSPLGRMTFFATEFDGDDTFFGYMVSPLGADCDEWGYQSLREMAEAFRGMPLVERDCYFTPAPVRDLIGEGA